jgi:hypothetical protein
MSLRSTPIWLPLLVALLFLLWFAGPALSVPSASDDLAGRDHGGLASPPEETMLAARSPAQRTSSSLSGACLVVRVTGPGGPVAGAIVKLQAYETDVVRTGETNDAGLVSLESSTGQVAVSVVQASLPEGLVAPAGQEKRSTPEGAVFAGPVRVTLQPGQQEGSTDQIRSAQVRSMPEQQR